MVVKRDSRLVELGKVHQAFRSCLRSICDKFAKFLQPPFLRQPLQPLGVDFRNRRDRFLLRFHGNADSDDRRGCNQQAEAVPAAMSRILHERIVVDAAA
jgi:hypothetical protein